MTRQVIESGTRSVQGVVLLLSACINPGNMTRLKRRDLATRRADYETALTKWLRVRDFQGIVFCENSAADLTTLQAIARAASAPVPQVEFLSFQGQNFDPVLGKGYGEMRIIRHALHHSQLLSSAGLIMKVTGRLFVRNGPAMVKELVRGPASPVYCDLRRNLSWADSRCFCATPEFIRDYLISYAEDINDSQGVYFEHVLARAAHRAMANGWPYAPMPRALWLKGVDGTANKTLPATFLHHARRSFFQRIKTFVLRRP